MSYKLIVNPGQETRWEIPLQDGITVLGSDPALPWPIAHGSVSAQHCQVEVAPNSVMVRDLGSECGTKIADQTVTESTLIPGERLRLGEIELELAEVPRTVSPPLAPKIPPTPARSARSVPTAKNVADQTSFFSTWAYPFKGDGAIILALGAVAYFVSEKFWPLALGFAGYMFLYGKEIVASSAEGHPIPPHWPVIYDWMEDIIKPFAQYFALFLVLLGPVILMRWLGNPWQESLGDVPVVIATVIGVFFVPAGIVVLALYDSFSGLNPLTLCSIFGRMPKAYLATALAFEVIVAAIVWLPVVAEACLPIPMVGGLVASFLNFYLFVVAMRNAGLLARKMA